MGTLLTTRGIVTRVSDVKPMVLVAVYTCDSCSTEVFQPVKTQQFMPLFDCPYQSCKSKNMRGTLQHQTKSSKFVEFQSLQIQEIPEEV